ncbi:MAG TPA: RNA polymerase sigma factor [Gemmatimonadaceae bacterium]|nr:RNA polymerase sigma factor [Gemmatimonadaceae bacterium]
MAELADEFARHHGAAFGWALACCRWDRSAAEDVLHTAYLRILDGRARFGGHGEFRAFLFGVIRRTASEERRRRAVRRALSLSWLRDDSREPSVPAVGLRSIAGEETSCELIAALQRLSPRQREVLHLVFYQDLSIAESAAVLGIGVGSARTHYERGKAQLRALLEKDGHHAE